MRLRVQADATASERARRDLRAITHVRRGLTRKLGRIVPVLWPSS